MRGAKKRARNCSDVAASLNEGVAPHLYTVAEIAVQPHRPCAHGTGRGAGGPVLQACEYHLAVHGCELDCEMGAPGDRLGCWGEAEKTPGPACGSSESRVLRECGVGPGA